jgi:hypothetical protein
MDPCPPVNTQIEMIVSGQFWVPQTAWVTVSGSTYSTRTHQLGGFLPHIAWKKVYALYTSCRAPLGRKKPEPALPKNPSCKEIEDRYWGKRGATLIVPNSWVDKRLQKAYHSRRKAKTKEETG